MGYDSDLNDMTAYIPCRKKREFIPDNKKDELYWEKRRKNNAAARKSREKRRYSDMALETRIVNMSRDNKRLRIELAAIKKHFGIPLDETFVSVDGDVPQYAHGYQTLCCGVSPPCTLIQDNGQRELLGQVEQKMALARRFSGSASFSMRDHCPGISLPSLESYTITNVQIPPFHASILPVDYSRRNIHSMQRELEPRGYPVKVEPTFYQQSKPCYGENKPIAMSCSKDLTEKTADFYNIPRSTVSQYNFSLSRSSTSASTASLTSSCSSNECDRRDEIEEESVSSYKDDH